MDTTERRMSSATRWPQMCFIAVLIACVVLGQPRLALAQTASVSPSRDATLYELVLSDGARLYGTIANQDQTEVVFTTEECTTVTAKRAQIASLKEITGRVVNGACLPPDRNGTRLFFGPTGRSVPKGATHLVVHELVMPVVQFGVTDRFSIGGGMQLNFGIGDWQRPFWVTPKLQLVKRARTQIAVGTFHMFDIGTSFGGIGYVVGTRGDTAASVTVGGGHTYKTGAGKTSVLMVGGERQVKRHLKVISENYIWNDGNGVASAGVRFFGDRLSADLALGIPIGTNNFSAFPILNVAYLFR